MEFMDRETMSSLDFQYILNKINVYTPYGEIYKKKMRAYLPGEEELLKEELDAVEELLLRVDEDFIKEISNLLTHVKDIRTSIKRAMRGISLTEVELFEIKSFLFLVRDISKFLVKKRVEGYEIEPIDKLEKALDPENTGVCTFYIYDSYSENLKRIRDEIKFIKGNMKKIKKAIKKKIEDDLNVKIGLDDTVTISKDKMDLIERIKDYPYLTYISENYLHIKYSIKKTADLIEFENKLWILKKKEEEEEEKIRDILTEKVKRERKRIWKNILNIGRLDFVLSKVVFAKDLKAVKPNIVLQHVLHIDKGRHPKIEENLNNKGLKFTPISVKLKEGVTVITGANMGGKTVSLKLIGMLTAMAQYGLFVPAENMTLGLNNFLKASIGDLQSIDKGLSTFGSEIKHIEEAIEISDNRGLILIDELARGTNPKEGYAISKAIVQYLKKKASITLMTTHYDNIGNIDGVLHLQVIGLANVDFKQLESKLLNSQEDKLDIINSIMNYELMEVQKENQVPKDAINIARIMGINPEIIKLAEKNLIEDNIQ